MRATQIADKPKGNLACEFRSHRASARNALAIARFNHCSDGGKGLTSEPPSASPSFFSASLRMAAIGKSKLLAYVARNTSKTEFWCTAAGYAALAQAASRNEFIRFRSNAAAAYAEAYSSAGGFYARLACECRSEKNGD